MHLFSRPRRILALARLHYRQFFCKAQNEIRQQKDLMRLAVVSMRREAHVEVNAIHFDSVG